jgi:hypothetical protein
VRQILSASLLEVALAFGVTTQLDMHTRPEFAADMRRQQEEGQAASRADLLSAGNAVTVPGGHGSTGIGSPPPLLTKAADADDFVAARVTEKSDYIKIIVDDGSVYGKQWPTLDRPSIEAVIRAAHSRGRRAVVHVARLVDAEYLVRAGADGLVHVWIDGVPRPDAIAEFRRRDIFVVHTLTVWKAGIARAGNRPPERHAREGGGARRRRDSNCPPARAESRASTCERCVSCRRDSCGLRKSLAGRQG